MLITDRSTLSFARKYAGGKGLNLFLLSKHDFPVPPWLILSSKVFDQFRQESGILPELTSALASLNKDTQPVEFENVSARIRQLIVETPLPQKVREQFKKAYAKFSEDVIAVRSSALDEDSSSHSFAGQLSSFLFVRSEEDVILSIRECWASAFSARSLSYRMQNNLTLNETISVAVVLQKMIFSEKSGVLFTCDPVNGDAARVYINSVYGVGEGLVSGHLDGDVFVLDKATGNLASQEIADKEERFVASQDQTGCVIEAVEEKLRDKASLSAPELLQLHDLAKKVEGFYKYPQDLEWAFCSGELYLLQTRPVTTPVKNGDGVLQIWDNSNIVESYGGITSPLSFSFARHNYHWVYVQFLEILMVPSREIRKMDYFLSNMLGLFYGRVYYNLLNWYKLTSILPGFKYNRSFMETMMGTDHSLGDEIADRIKPPRSQESFKSKFIRTLAGIKFIYFHFTIQSMVDRFLAYFHEVYGQYRVLDYSRMPADAIQQKYREVEERLLLEWKAPIVNDYLCMVHFGLLRKLTGLWLKDLGPEIQNDLLCGNGNLESAEPTRELIRMATYVEKNPTLKELLMTTSSEDCLEVLANSQAHEEFYTRVLRYMDLYGFRCMNEMKLEEIDLYQDPTFLFVCLKNYLRTGAPDLHEYELREARIRSEAEEKVKGQLKGIRKAIYFWSLHHARKAVRNRENTRFCRTRIYGVARAMFNGIGRDFVSRGILTKQEDIHFLEMQEVWGAIDGTLTVQNLKALVSLRKQEYSNYSDADPSPRFITRGPPYWQNLHSEELKSELVDRTDLLANQLRGTGACPGLVEAKAKVILNPGDDMELNGEILVTLRTDPGWIPLYPAVSGLLVERGGLLSHSAIVAREMGLPTIVGIQKLTKSVRSGARLKMDGESGMIEIIEEA